MTATTALTAQNTQGVYGIHETPTNFVQKQIDACIDDIGVDVLKTGRNREAWSCSIYRGEILSLVGMLASAQTIAAVATAIQQHNVARTVVDPVWPSFQSKLFMHSNQVRLWSLQVAHNCFQKRP